MSLESSEDSLESGQGSERESSLAERVAVLEERTAPRKQSKRELGKEWAGIVSLGIAIFYSFPLGLWDKFITSEEERKAQQLEDLRAVVEDTTKLVAEYARSVSGITDPRLSDMIQRATNTRLYVLMSKHHSEFEARTEDFVAPELLVIGYNFLHTNQPLAAEQFFHAAERKAGADQITKIEAIRARAKISFMSVDLQDISLGRTLYSSAENLSKLQGTPMGIHTYITILAEWGLVELLHGDWSCGLQKSGMALDEYKNYSSVIGDNGNLGRLIEQQLLIVGPRPKQSNVGC